MKATRKEVSLWSLADCVDFLRERGCNNYLYLLHHETPLIVCQEAVLTILQEEK